MDHILSAFLVNEHVFQVSKRHDHQFHVKPYIHVIQRTGLWLSVPNFMKENKRLTRRFGISSTDNEIGPQRWQTRANTRKVKKFVRLSYSRRRRAKVVAESTCRSIEFETFRKGVQVKTKEDDQKRNYNSFGEIMTLRKSKMVTLMA